LSAFVSDPEFNWFRRRAYVVTVANDRIEFRNPQRAGDVMVGAWDRAADRLDLPLLSALPSVVLTRRAATDAAGFFPRAGGDTAYRYAPPVAANDGWPVATLSEVGLDRRPLAELIDQILTANPGDNPLDIHSLLIARHGKLVLEEYFYGSGRDEPHDMRSASKTFTGVLAGTALDHGAAIGPDTPVYEQFADLRPFQRWDDRKSRMTLGDLMTMTSGLACNDNDDASPGNEDTMQGQSSEPNWYKYTLGLPMAGDPGGRHAVYCSAGVNLAAGVVARVTRSWLPDLFDANVARPLGFGTYHINLMPTGEAYSGGGLRLRPRDELKLGQLYLGGGVWNGHRIVSADWVAQSIASHTEFDPQTDYDAPHEYGFGWHINHLRAGGRDYRVYSAGGNGGQIIMVIPDLDMVVGFNGGSYAEFTKWYRWGLQLVPKYIIPAVGTRP
jgi:CubicO group peptidase (beta-lactamase class C family)